MLEAKQFKKEKLSDDFYKMLPPGPRGKDDPMFIKQQGKWLYLAAKESSLENLPADPVKLLDGLDKKYLFAFQVYPQNEGIKWLEKAMQEPLRGLQQSAAMAATRGMPLSEPPPSEPITFARMGPMGAMLAQNQDQIDTLTLGLMFDKTGNSMTDLQLDLQIKALPGSKLQKGMSESSGIATQFAGFYDPKKTLSSTLTSKISDEQVMQLKMGFAMFQQFGLQGLNQHDLSEDEVAFTKECMAKLTEVINATIDQKVLDLGFQFQGVPEHSTMILGVKVADGQKLEEIVRKLSENQLFADDEGNKVTVTMNVGSGNGVKFHKIEPVPPSPVFGSNAEMVVGVASDAFYIGIGNKPVDKLKAAIQTSQGTSTEKPLVLQTAVDVPKMLQLLSTQSAGGPRMIPESIIKSFGKKPGNTAMIQIIPIENGLTFRLELTPSLVGTLLNSGMKSAMPPMPNGGMPPMMPPMMPPPQ